MSLTKRLQLKTEEYIEEISDELNILVLFYPKVYWVGKNFSFKKAGINKSRLEEFYNFKRNLFKSIYLPDQKVILVGEENLECLSEEAGHFIHFSNTEINKKRLTLENRCSLRIISEMLGYFCSKLIFPGRINEYADYPDPLFERERFEKFLFKKPIDKNDFCVYKQGYDLGEILFNAYISKIIPKKEIKKLFLMDFKKPNSGLCTYLGLKFNLLNFEKKFIN